MQAWGAGHGSPWLWAGGWIGAIITSLYTFRMVYYVFFGEAKTEATLVTNRAITVPLLVLAFFSLVAGFVEVPRLLGGRPWFTNFLQTVLPAAHAEHLPVLTEIALLLASTAAAVGGIGLAYQMYQRRRSSTEQVLAQPFWTAAMRFLHGGMGFDWLYERLCIRPYVWLARVNRGDVVDAVYTSLARLGVQSYRALSAAQNGRVRWYAAGIAVGAILFIVMLVVQ